MGISRRPWKQKEKRYDRSEGEWEAHVLDLNYVGTPVLLKAGRFLLTVFVT